MMRVVIVGSGVAGLSVALRAAREHEVVVVTKATRSDGSTRWAQGGVAAALDAADSVAAHVADTLRAGAGLADPRAVQLLCAEGRDRVRELIALGIPFDRDGDGIALGREAAHSARRIVHAGGDATGLAIETGLLDAASAVPIRWLTETMLCDLVRDDGRVVGVELLTPEGRRVLGADAVVLATGGAGRLFRHTTNPEVVTGDGIAAALRAGAAVADLEFVQFHPTALAVPGTPLISEAVRGEGAVLRDAGGHRFLLDEHPDAELAPRDVVARGIVRAMARQGGAPVLLDATGLGGRLRHRFPGLDAAMTAAGFDWTREPIPVTPAAHYLMGGVMTDLDGRTSVPGLFAVGEVARTGVHGANRLASNSLLEGLVFGARAAAALGEPAAPGVLPSVDPEPVPVGPNPSREAVEAPPFRRAALQELMWSHAGIERDGPGLRHAAGVLALWAANRAARHDPLDVAAVEDLGMLDLARALVHAALAREESRGAHHRTDHPETDPAQGRPLAWIAPAAIPEPVR
jgi:L-aspartate oxidase